MRRSNLREIEQFAGEISHPIEKLRFLHSSLSQPARPARRSYKASALTASLAMWLLLTVPALEPSVPDARAPSFSSAAAQEVPVTVLAAETQNIWQVERTASYETYSNGLRVDNSFSVGNHPRWYLVFPLAGQADRRGERRAAPAGIVFHTTESLQVPFEPGNDSQLKRAGESVLAYVRRRKSYNFLIDRFGQVHRVVRESDAANHAGNSVWSDQKLIYLNLNESFIGVSFEAQTLPGQTEATINPSQIWSAGLLTAMLRERYGIPAGNCVTHAQVSVNASGLRIGYHIDWASSFPFADAGLPDNYALPLPAVYLFGFGYDSDFAHRAGPRMYEEAEESEEVLRERATQANLRMPAYRKSLQERYRRLEALVREDRADRTDSAEE